LCVFFTLLPVIKLIKDHWHGSRHISVIINETYKFNELSNDRQTVMLRTVYGMAKWELGKFFFQILAIVGILTPLLTGFGIFQLFGWRFTGFS
jgi:hypothetical protein